MKKLPFTLRLAWVSRLALLLVGFCCLVPSARAADNFNADFPPDTFPYEAYYGLHVLITGAYEQVWIIDDIAQFRDLAGDATNRLLIVEQYCSSCGSDLSQLVSYADDMASRYPDIPPEEWGFINGLRYWAQEMGAVSELCSNGVSFVDTMANSPQLADVLSRAVYTADGDLSGFDGSGGCDCADWLQSILSRLTTIESHTSSLKSMIYQWDHWLIAGSDRGILPFVYNFNYGLTQFYRDSFNNTPAYFANDIGVVVSNAAFTVSSLQGWARIRDIWNGLFESGGDWYADESNPLAKRLADVWTRFLWFTEPNAPADFDNPYILGWRDFQETKNNHPTNTIDNPLWVAFTNSVTLSSDALVKLDPSSLLSVAVTNFNDFISGLEHANIYVQVTNTVNVRVDTQSQKTEFDAMLGDLEDPTEDTVEYAPVDLSPLSSLGDTLGGVFSSYAGMFASIPDEMPQRIFIHEGWTLGVIEVPSIWWDLDSGKKSGGISRGLSLIRGCFSAVWIVGYLIVIAFFAAVDIFVAGVCLYCCYGLLAGDSKTALHGVRHMFILLCGFLGFKAPFSESL